MNQNDLMTQVSSEEYRRPPLVVSVGQFVSAANVTQNLKTIEELSRKAANSNSDLIVFPEASMFQWNASGKELALAASRYGDLFLERVKAIAIQNQIAMIVGSYHTEQEQKKPLNRLTAIDKYGKTLASYDKVHLYDAYSWVESDAVTPGPINGDFSELGVFDIHGWRVGMLNCYDLRFPEIARGLSERGADIISMSSAWVSGPLKEFHLSTLSAARAIETTSYVIVANQGVPLSTGRSSILSPFGNTIATADLVEDLITVPLRYEVIKNSREQLPIRHNRRYAASPSPHTSQSYVDAVKEI